MAVTKLMPDKYEFSEDIRRLLYFMADPLKCTTGTCGGRNVLGSVITDPDEIALQFITLQADRSCSRRAYHYIVSFDPVIDQADMRFAEKLGQAICGLYQDFQSVFVLHDDSSYMHLHVVFNNAPIFTGTGCLSQYFNKLALDECVDRYIDRHMGM